MQRVVTEKVNINPAVIWIQNIIKSVEQCEKRLVMKGAAINLMGAEYFQAELVLRVRKRQGGSFALVSRSIINNVFARGTCKRGWSKTTCYLFE